MLIARAPGKLFLLGEYAVLDGAPAVLAAVNRFVEVRLRDGDGTCAILAPGVAETLRFPAGQLPRPEGPLRFVLAAWQSAQTRFPVLADRALHLEVQSDLAAADGRKLGLGSSAAVTVAAVAALFAAGGADVASPAGRALLLAAADEAHRGGQLEAGSGADLATAVYGGVIRFERSAEEGGRVRPLTLPPEARFLAGWTGTPASTGDLVRRYRELGNGLQSVRETFVERSRRVVSDFVTALQEGRLSRTAVDANGDLLARLAADLGLPILTPRLNEAIEIARRYGVAAKSSGAGGGDCVVALAGDEVSAVAVRRAWREAGIEPLDLAIEQKGVTVRAS